MGTNIQINLKKIGTEAGCLDTVCSIFEGTDIPYKVLPFIPSSIFPNELGTQIEQYKSTHSILVSTGAEKFSFQRIRNYFMELSDNVYKGEKEKHPVTVRIEGLKNDSWDKPRKVFKYVIGHCGEINPHLIQILFCHKNDFQLILDCFHENLFFSEN
jgi:hypothetical protein